MRGSRHTLTLPASVSRYNLFWKLAVNILGFPVSSVGKESACNAGDPGSIPGVGRSPGEGIGYPLQYSWASLVAQLVKKIFLQCRRPGFDPWVGKIPSRREKLPISVFWPGEFHGLYSPWGPKELDRTEWLSLSLHCEHFMCTSSATWILLLGICSREMLSPCRKAWTKCSLPLETTGVSSSESYEVSILWDALKQFDKMR